MYIQEIETVELQFKINNKHQNITLTDIYLMFNIELNFFFIKMIKTKEIMIRIKQETLYMMNKRERMLN